MLGKLALYFFVYVDFLFIIFYVDISRGIIY